MLNFERTSYRLHGLCTGSKRILPLWLRCWRWVRWWRVERWGQQSLERPPLTLQQTNLHQTPSAMSPSCSSTRTFGLTFHIERGGAGGRAVVVLRLAVVDSGVLGEYFDQKQRVLIAVVKELALEARRQSLGVFVPGDLRWRNAAHLNGEASRLSCLDWLGLHVTEDLRRLRDWKVICLVQGYYCLGFFIAVFFYLVVTFCSNSVSFDWF